MVSKMLSTVVIFLLLDLAASADIVFLSPRPGQEFASNDSVQVKWRKVEGATKFNVTWESDDGMVFEAPKAQSRCNPRVSMPEGIQQEFLSRAHRIEGSGETTGNDTRTWIVTVIAQNAAGEIIGVDSIMFKVCPNVPCSKRKECPSEQSVRYYTAPGYKIQGFSHSTFGVANEKACVDNCTANVLGRCKSVNYNSRTNMCEYYMKATLPQGSAQLVNDTAMNYSEKVCVNTTFADRCPGPYFVAPRTVLYGQGKALINVTEMRECLEYCMDSQTHFGYVCRSAGFVTSNVYNGDPYSCALSTETRLTQPDSYVSDPDADYITYLEPGCAIAM